MIIRSILLALTLGAAACGGGKKESTTSTVTQPSGKSLYDRLGGVDAIKAVVKDFVEEQVAKDAETRPALLTLIGNQVAELAGYQAEVKRKKL